MNRKDPEMLRGLAERIKQEHEWRGGFVDGLIAYRKENYPEIEKAMNKNLFKGGGMITVVSGLPRSGTSMMMQMLIAGGMGATYTPDYRPADSNNPQGYFEVLPVELEHPDSILDSLDGGCIKLVANQIKHLPLVNVDYPHGKMESRIIFMRRNMRSITDSAERMIHTSKADLDYLFSKTLADLLKYLNTNELNYMQVWYEDVLKNPVEESKRVSDFLCGDKLLDWESMAKEVK